MLLLGKGNLATFFARGPTCVCTAGGLHASTSEQTHMGGGEPSVLRGRAHRA